MLLAIPNRYSISTRFRKACMTSEDSAQATDDRSKQLLGDSVLRNYSRKLDLFNSFAAPELRRAVANLPLRPSMVVVDAGCGTGGTMNLFREVVAPPGRVIGLDLAQMHVIAARATAVEDALVVQADLTKPPIAPGTVDLVWSMNTINHLRDPDAAATTLAALLRPQGAIALAQSSFLADMYFAWDARLEEAVRDAVHRYYRDRYGVDGRELAGIRALVGLLRRAGLKGVSAHTYVIERIAPLDPASEAYINEALFLRTWQKERISPYLSAEDMSAVARLCDPTSAEYALRRPDFHFLQTFTVVLGYVS